MIHCLACDAIISPWENYCEECKEEISLVYTDDRSYISFLKGLHPSNIPYDFVSVCYAWEIDQN